MDENALDQIRSCKAIFGTTSFAVMLILLMINGAVYLRHWYENNDYLAMILLVNSTLLIGGSFCAGNWIALYRQLNRHSRIYQFSRYCSTCGKLID